MIVRQPSSLLGAAIAHGYDFKKASDPCMGFAAAAANVDGVSTSKD